MMSLIYILGIFLLPFVIILYILRRYESFFEPRIAFRVDSGVQNKQGVAANLMKLEELLTQGGYNPTTASAFSDFLMKLEEQLTQGELSQIQTKSFDTLGLLYANIGRLYNRIGQMDKALAYSQRALEIFERVGDTHGMAKTLRNLGDVYAGIDNLDKALASYRKALEIIERMGSIQGDESSVRTKLTETASSRK